ncbi:MAG: universal stress protein [Acidaminococcaceae bacterium]
MLTKILVPIDGSETAYRALAYAMELGKAYGSEIIVGHVSVPYDFTKLPPRKPKNAIEEADMAKEAKNPTPIEIAQAQTAQAGYTKVTFREAVALDPAARIIGQAKLLGVDLIVMGNRGMGVLAGFLMGSVSTKVAQSAECPVVIVK